MSAMFEISLESEFLSAEEIVQITGCPRRMDQLAWLQAKGWQHHTNRAGVPIVGRMYTRLKLAGINVQALAAGGAGGAGAWTPDFSGLLNQSASPISTNRLRH